MCPVTPEETAGLDPVVSNEQSVTVSEAQSFPNSGGGACETGLSEVHCPCPEPSKNPLSVPLIKHHYYRYLINTIVTKIPQ